MRQLTCHEIDVMAEACFNDGKVPRRLSLGSRVMLPPVDSPIRMFRGDSGEHRMEFASSFGNLSVERNLFQPPETAQVDGEQPIAFALWTARNEAAWSQRSSCPYCGSAGGHVNLRGGHECAGCGALQGRPADVPHWENDPMAYPSTLYATNSFSIDWSSPGGVLTVGKDEWVWRVA